MAQIRHNGRNSRPPSAIDGGTTRIHAIRKLGNEHSKFADEVRAIRVFAALPLSPFEHLSPARNAVSETKKPKRWSTAPSTRWRR